MRGFLQRGWRNQVPNVLLCDFSSFRRINFKVIVVCFNRKFYKFDHGCHGFLDEFRNRLIVKDGFREIRIDHSAKAKEDDITEKLRVISAWTSDERVIARLIN
jgi:hypothetical protein